MGNVAFLASFWFGLTSLLFTIVCVLCIMFCANHKSSTVRTLELLVIQVCGKILIHFHTKLAITFDAASTAEQQQYIINYNRWLAGSRKMFWYLQLTLNCTVVSSLWPSGIARFHTTHRYLTPSSSRLGEMVRVLVVCKSFDPPRLMIACMGEGLPSLYHLNY